MKGKILLIIQLVSELDQLTAADYRLVMGNPVQPQQGELFLLEDVTITAQESSVIRQILDLQLDREFDGVQTVGAATSTSRILRRIIKQRDNSIRPFRYLALIRGELEIETFGWQILEQKFTGNSPVLSLPFLLFIDGFGVH